MQAFDYLFKEGVIDKARFLINHFHLLELDTKTLTFILLVDAYNDKNEKLPFKETAKKMKISENELNDIYEELKNNRQLIHLKNAGAMPIIDTSNVYLSIAKELEMISISQEMANQALASETKEKNIVGIFEEEFKRKFSPFEIETIREWTNVYSQELILDCLKTSVIQGVLNLKYVEEVIKSQARILNG